VHDPDDLHDVYLRMVERFGEDMRPAVVQAMAQGVEVQVSAHQSASFGGVIAVGLGGPARGAAVESSVRVLPLTDVDARALIESSPVAPMLESMGEVGNLPAPTGADVEGHLDDVVLRLAAVVDAIPELADVVLNPVTVTTGAARLVDARIRVAPYRWDPSPEVRRLT
jgi:hypothetical protein